MRDGAFLAFCSGSKRIAHGLRRAWPIDEHGNFPAYSRGAQTRGAQTRVRRARPAKRPCLSGAILGPGVCAPQPRAPSEVWPGQAARGRGCHAIGATPVLRRQLPWAVATSSSDGCSVGFCDQSNTQTPDGSAGRKESSAESLRRGFGDRDTSNRARKKSRTGVKRALID